MIKRIDETTDTQTLKDALIFYTERKGHYLLVSRDDHLLEYYKLMVEYIKDILTAREGEGER